MSDSKWFLSLEKDGTAGFGLAEWSVLSEGKQMLPKAAASTHCPSAQPH